LANPADRLRDALAGRYLIERELGRGGFSTVYLARDLKHDRPVAIKPLGTESAWTQAPERFLREIGLAAQLSHPTVRGKIDRARHSRWAALGWASHSRRAVR